MAHIRRVAPLERVADEPLEAGDIPVRNRARKCSVSSGVRAKGAAVVVLVTLAYSGAMAAPRRATGVERLVPWPTAEEAEPFARELIASVPPPHLVSSLTFESIPPLFRGLGSALMSDDEGLQREVESYLNAVTIAAARRPDSELRMLVAMQLVDPPRYRADRSFRERVDRLLPGALDASVSRAMREACLEELGGVAGIDYDTVEAVALSWQLAPRLSEQRKVPFMEAVRIPDDVAEPIIASIFSINSGFFTAEEARRFLRAVRRSSPKRQIIVLADAAIRNGLGEELAAHSIDTAGRPLTPWPRDPFMIARSADGGVVFVNRPNAQPNREEDAHFVRTIVRSIPESLDRQWKGARWTVAPTPFHNGHVLLMPDAAWISIHTVEIRTLQILGVERVPVETFRSATGIKRYLDAVRTAATELEVLYRRPVRFVHPLPESEPLPDQMRLMYTLGGGAGFDLDSLVTLLPRSDGSLRALVGDIRLGSRMALDADPTEWNEFHRRYGFSRGAAELGLRLAESQNSARHELLQAYLDLVASHLSAERLPLLNVPTRLLADPSAVSGSEFLMTWNNVVLEGRRAEGFASLFTRADHFARRVFEKLGYTLELFPPLIRSILLNGGYRCASNHLRWQLEN